MAEHAKLSASSSERWLNCTPSAMLEANCTNETSVYAAEGTAAHSLAEHKLRRCLGQKSKRPVSEFDSDELEHYTDDYVAFATELITLARTHCTDPIVLMEQRLDFSQYVPEGFGTGDLVIVADDMLDIADLKYGKGVPVYAEDNSQMRLYALGALALFDHLYDIKTVRMSICQPRLESISTCEMSVADLLEWAENELKPKAQLAIRGEGEFCTGDHCRFCKVRNTCRARADSFLDLAKHDFKLPSLLNDNEIAEVLKIANQLSTWATDVYAYASDLAIREGKVWNGFKLVEGRSNRRYANDEAVAETLTNAGFGDIYKKSLLGITDMERYLGKKQFATLLDGLIEKPQGKPTLVPIEDKRDPITLNTTANADFGGNENE